MLRLVALVLALATTSAACTSADDGAAAGLPPLGASMMCDDPIAAFDAVPEAYRAVGDVVAFPTSDLLQRGRVGPDNDSQSGRAFSKLGLVVRSGAAFQLHVAGESEANALMQWGNVGPSDPVSSISVEGCDGSCEVLIQLPCDVGDTAAWIVYPGGVWTLEPACISLVVLTEDESAVVELPAGERCD